MDSNTVATAHALIQNKGRLQRRVDVLEDLIGGSATISIGTGIVGAEVVVPEAETELVRDLAIAMLRRQITAIDVQLHELGITETVAKTEPGSTSDGGDEAAAHPNNFMFARLPMIFFDLIDRVEKGGDPMAGLCNCPGCRKNRQAAS